MKKSNEFENKNEGRERERQREEEHRWNAGRAMQHLFGQWERRTNVECERARRCIAISEER